MYKFDIYAAGPLGIKNLEGQDKVVALYEKYDLIVFDPKKHGPLLGQMKPEERTPEVFQQILDANIRGILDSKMTIACIDNRDIGTMWELGFAYGWSKNNEENGMGYSVGADEYNIPLITYSNENYGNNVMISQSVDAHFFNFDSLESFIRDNSELLINGSRKEIREFLANNAVKEAATE